MCACPSADAGTHTPRPLVWPNCQWPLLQQPPVVMGPCVRRDDERWVWSALSDSNFKQPSPMRPHSRGVIRPGYARNSRPLQRAQGMPDAWCVRSRAWWVVNTRVSHHGHTGNIRHSPRNGFNGLFRALPGDRACLSPSPADHSANLTPASRRQDHTTSPSASAPFVKGASASTASRLTSVTIAKRPSSEAGQSWI